jgi:hypothetical protein
MLHLLWLAPARHEWNVGKEKFTLVGKTSMADARMNTGLPTGIEPVIVDLLQVPTTIASLRLGGLFEKSHEATRMTIRDSMYFDQTCPLNNFHFTHRES